MGFEDEEDDAPFPTVPGYSNSHSRTNHSANLELEQSLYPNEDPVQRAKRLLKEAADGAAATLVEIALHGSTEKLRLDAAKTILDRVIGPVSQVQPTDDESPLERMLKDLEHAANGDGGQQR
jgi:hypothetical protein